jgi:hypothetical protein
LKKADTVRRGAVTAQPETCGADRQFNLFGGVFWSPQN